MNDFGGGMQAFGYLEHWAALSVFAIGGVAVTVLCAVVLWRNLHNG
jgi:hypothetical protein